jgi:hypothetical protein
MGSHIGAHHARNARRMGHNRVLEAAERGFWHGVLVTSRNALSRAVPVALDALPELITR